MNRTRDHFYDVDLDEDFGHCDEWDGRDIYNEEHAMTVGNMSVIIVSIVVLAVVSVLWLGGVFDSDTAGATHDHSGVAVRENTPAAGAVDTLKNKHKITISERGVENVARAACSNVNMIVNDINRVPVGGDVLTDVVLPQVSDLIVKQKATIVGEDGDVRYVTADNGAYDIAFYSIISTCSTTFNDAVRAVAERDNRG